MIFDLTCIKEILEELESNESFFISYKLNREDSIEDKKLGHCLLWMMPNC